MPWKIGDVVGLACDLDLEASSKTITFYLNGKSMGVAFANVDYVCGLTPAMTVQVQTTIFAESLRVFLPSHCIFMN